MKNALFIIFSALVLVIDSFNPSQLRINNETHYNDNLPNSFTGDLKANIVRQISILQTHRSKIWLLDEDHSYNKFVDDGLALKVTIFILDIK